MQLHVPDAGTRCTTARIIWMLFKMCIAACGGLVAMKQTGMSRTPCGRPVCASCIVSAKAKPLSCAGPGHGVCKKEERWSVRR